MCSAGNRTFLEHIRLQMVINWIPTNINLQIFENQVNIWFYNKSFHRCTWTYCSVKTQNRNVKARMQVEHGVLNYFFIFPQLIFFVAYVLILLRKSVSVSQMKKWYMNINNKPFVVLKGYLVLSDAVQNVSVFFCWKNFKFKMFVHC